MNFKEWLDDKLLVILRAIPGAGKSTLANELLKLYPNALIFSTDQFFHQDDDFNKPYVFDFNKLGYFHQKNRDRATEAMKEGKTVIIDNTNISPRDADPYIKVAYDLSYKILVKEPDTEWKFDADILAHKNQHGVPLDKIKQMIQRWMPHDQFIDHFKQKYQGIDIR